MSETLLVHGTCVAIDGVGVLLRGQPGAGKSDLALRLIDRGGVLVADDQTRLEAAGDTLFASAPKAIEGLLEVRGFGIVACPNAGAVALGLVIDLVDGEFIERLPEPEYVTFLGLRCRRHALDPVTASADAKVRLAVRLLRDDK